MMSMTPAITLTTSSRKASGILTKNGNTLNYNGGIYRKKNKRKAKIRKAKEYAKVVNEADPADIYLPDPDPNDSRMKREEDYIRCFTNFAS